VTGKTALTSRAHARAENIREFRATPESRVRAVATRLAGLVLEIDVSQGLTVGVADAEALAGLVRALTLVLASSRPRVPRQCAIIEPRSALTAAASSVQHNWCRYHDTRGDYDRRATTTGPLLG
jgi:hypothetical protein